MADSSGTASNSIEEALRSRDAFLRLATHELRGLLSAIQLHTDTLSLIVKKGASQEDVELRAEKITRQVQRMARRLEEIMELARASSGRFVLIRRDSDLVLVVRAEVARARDDLARAGSRVELALPDTLTGNWDQARLELAVETLVMRAARVAGERIAMVVRPDEGGARLEVTHDAIDDAPGETAAFDSFEAAMAATGPAAPTLSLWLARKIIEEHGGRFELEPRRGSLWLPLDGTKVATPPAA